MTMHFMYLCVYMVIWKNKITVLPASSIYCLNKLSTHDWCSVSLQHCKTPHILCFHHVFTTLQKNKFSDIQKNKFSNFLVEKSKRSKASGSFWLYRCPQYQKYLYLSKIRYDHCSSFKECLMQFFRATTFPF